MAWEARFSCQHTPLSTFGQFWSELSRITSWVMKMADPLVFKVDKIQNVRSAGQGLTGRGALSLRWGQKSRILDLFLFSTLFVFDPLAS